MKLRKLITSIRHWLIKKLGGYTEQKIPPQVRHLPSVTLHPERVVSQVRMSYWEAESLLGDAERERLYADRIRRDLTAWMVKKIIEEGLGVLSCEPDLMCGPEGRIYSMAICIVSPNEWMKTSLGDFMAPDALRRKEQ